MRDSFIKWFIKADNIATKLYLKYKQNIKNLSEHTHKGRPIELCQMSGLKTIKYPWIKKVQSAWRKVCVHETQTVNPSSSSAHAHAPPYHSTYSSKHGNRAYKSIRCVKPRKAPSLQIPHGCIRVLLRLESSSLSTKTSVPGVPTTYSESSQVRQLDLLPFPPSSFAFDLNCFFIKRYKKVTFNMCIFLAH